MHHNRSSFTSNIGLSHICHPCHPFFLGEIPIKKSLIFVSQKTFAWIHSAGRRRMGSPCGGPFARWRPVRIFRALCDQEGPVGRRRPFEAPKPWSKPFHSDFAWRVLKIRVEGMDRYGERREESSKIPSWLDQLAFRIMGEFWLDYLNLFEPWLVHGMIKMTMVLEKKDNVLKFLLAFWQQENNKADCADCLQHVPTLIPWQWFWSSNSKGPKQKTRPGFGCLLIGKMVFKLLNSSAFSEDVAIYQLKPGWFPWFFISLSGKTASVCLVLSSGLQLRCFQTI